jgi:hypothetical protein
VVGLSLLDATEWGTGKAVDAEAKTEDLVVLGF